MNFQNQTFFGIHNIQSIVNTWYFALWELYVDYRTDDLYDLTCSHR
ncbi:Uncharacterised protein [Vibrio cholerae]|nr:Uncharacterised protein [Vibrio cholerae]